ncbi:hypothetical protein SDC9_112709 [bioreactor metagenome]|uniref:Uncharacterized protein n=1 Tax=bioreactor metagenome TaxID=1076179 RepID=A0A645BKG6_9ZZZZ
MIRKQQYRHERKRGKQAERGAVAARNQRAKRDNCENQHREDARPYCFCAEEEAERDAERQHNVARVEVCVPDRGEKPPAIACTKILRKAQRVDSIVMQYAQKAHDTCAKQECPLRPF